MTKDYLKAALAGVYSRSAAKMEQAGDHEALLGAISESQKAVQEIMTLDPNREEPSEKQQD
jgi:hypothetical protein